MASAITVQNIIDYYVNLLIIQYHDLPNAKAQVDLFIEELIANGVMFDVRDGYDIDSAIGLQLDILGKYVGTDRFYYSTDLSADFFGFADADDIAGVSANIIGFDDADAPDKEGEFLNSEKVISTLFELNDDSFRTLLKLKIIQNSVNHSFQSIADSIFDIFGSNVIFTDNYDMTITYLIDDSLENSFLINAILQKGCFPKPAGVALQAISGTEFFGFADANNLSAVTPYVKGFNDADVGLIKEGGFLNSDSDIQ